MAEGEGGVAIPAGVIPGQGEVGSVFDGKNAREWALAEECHQPLGCIGDVWGIGEGDITSLRRQPLNEPERIGSMDPDRLAHTKCLYVGSERREGAGR
jgi:hypothetical protein